MRISLDLTDPRDWEEVLEALVRISVRQRRRGVVPALSATRVRYVREPRGQEHWQTAAQSLRSGEGDCEDLAVYLVADARVRGVPARVVVRRVGQGKYHALALISGKLVDPSRARGMGRKAKS